MARVFAMETMLTINLAETIYGQPGQDAAA